MALTLYEPAFAVVQLDHATHRRLAAIAIAGVAAYLLTWGAERSRS